MKKRVLSMLLALVMALSIAVPAFTAEEFAVPETETHDHEHEAAPEAPVPEYPAPVEADGGMEMPAEEPVAEEPEAVEPEAAVEAAAEPLTVEEDVPVPTEAGAADGFVYEVTPKDTYWTKHGDNVIYCHLPTVTVRGAGLTRVEYVAKIYYPKEKVVEGSAAVVDGAATVIFADDAQGAVTVTATASDGTTKELLFTVNHTLGGRPSTRIEATCTEPARDMMTYQCGVCSENYDWSTKNVAGSKPLGHEYDAEHPIKLCGQDGVEVSLCKRGCGALVTSKGEEYKGDLTGGHEWHTETKEATCTEEGYTAQVCSKCHAVKEKVTTHALGHRWGAFKVENSGNCLTGGNKMVRECLNACGETDVIKLAGGHTYQRVVLEDYKDKLTENEIWDNKWTATCTTAGWVGDVCTVCFKDVKNTYESPSQAPALGHDYSSTGNCTEQNTCNRCGQVVDGNTSHNWEYTTTETTHTRKCTNTGCKVSEGETAHKFLAGDCTVAQVCEICGYKQTKTQSHNLQYKSDETHHWQECQNPGCDHTTAKTAHSLTDNSKDCTKGATCSVCGYVALAKQDQHSWGPWQSSNSLNHYRVCQNKGCAVIERKEHVRDNDHDCKTPDKCTECGETLVPAATMHNTHNSPIQGDENGHYQVCTNSGCTQQVRLAGGHSGGTATCSTKAQCEVCHRLYGEMNKQNHEKIEVVDYKEPTATEEGYTGNKVCTACGAVVEYGEPIEKKECMHDFSGEQEFDDNGSWHVCTKCGAHGPVTPHTPVKKQDGTFHWEECSSCNHATPKIPHVGTYDRDCTTPVTCECGYVMEAAKEHAAGEEWISDNTGHWHVCANENCDQIVEGAAQPHVGSDNNDCTKEQKCSVCDFVMQAGQEAHNYSSVVSGQDAAGHWYACENEGCEVVNKVDHVPEKKDTLCTTPELCEVCLWEITAAKEHVLDEWQADGISGHYQECTNEGCEYKTTVVPHTGPAASCVSAAVCDVCGEQYQEKDPNSHVPGKEVIDGHVNATEEAEGYSGDKKCSACGAIIESGHTLLKLTGDQAHSHDFGGYLSDAEKHWRECGKQCGTWTDEAPHTMTWTATANGHVSSCVCGYATAEEPHTFSGATCTKCGAKNPGYRPPVDPGPWYPPEPDPTPTPTPTPTPGPGTQPSPSPAPVTPPKSGSGWTQDGDYFFVNGEMKKEYWVLNGSSHGLWYHVGADGKLTTGFHYITDKTHGSGWYMLQTTDDNGMRGAMLTGWQQTGANGWGWFEDRHNGRYGECTYTESWGNYNPASGIWDVGGTHR